PSPTLRPPRPTLFPYTTLFRSVPVRDRGEPPDLGAIPALYPRAGHRPSPRRGRGDFPEGNAGRGAYVGVLPQRPPRLRRGPPHPDRKSTRLNSSHGSISYAVFC